MRRPIVTLFVHLLEEITIIVRLEACTWLLTPITRKGYVMCRVIFKGEGEP
jgi:hypothetical protein